MTSAGCTARLCQGASPGLLGSSHQATHLDFYLSDYIKVLAIVHVDHHEFEILHLLEIVGQRDAGIEVRIQVVIYNFCLGDLNPTVVFLFVKTALGVRLAERIQVFKFAA